MSWRLLLILPFLCACSVHQVSPEGENLRLRLRAPEATTVYLCCSCCDFAPQAAVKVDSRTWQVVVPNVSEFRYFYLVDGQVFVPPCRQRENDDYGGCNCIYESDL